MAVLQIQPTLLLTDHTTALQDQLATSGVERARYYPHDPRKLQICFFFILFMDIFTLTCTIRQFSHFLQVKLTRLQVKKRTKQIQTSDLSDKSNLQDTHNEDSSD